MVLTKRSQGLKKIDITYFITEGREETSLALPLPLLLL